MVKIGLKIFTYREIKNKGGQHTPRVSAQSSQPKRDDKNNRKYQLKNIAKA